MRMMIAGVVLLAGVSAGQACNADLLTVEAWSIVAIDERTNQIDLTISTASERPIKMIDGSISFYDALDESIGAMAIDRDLSISSEAAYEQSGFWGQYTFERMLDLNKSDVKTKTCVRAVQYGDGTVERLE